MTDSERIAEIQYRVNTPYLTKLIRVKSYYPDVAFLLKHISALERERDKAQNEASHFRVRWAEDKERLEKENQALHDALKKWGIYLAFDGGAGVEEE